MALGMNDFRSIVIKADAANTSIAPIRLSQNDQDGRRIVFELWNGAESIAATGLTARLLFGVGEGGYATMTAVSGAPTATWAVDVPQEALQTAGVVRMAVEVASGSQAVCTRIFDAVVEPALIDEDSPEAQDALSEFREAVARLDDFTVPVPIANGGTGATSARMASLAFGVQSKYISDGESYTFAPSGRLALIVCKRAQVWFVGIVDESDDTVAVISQSSTGQEPTVTTESNSAGFTVKNNRNIALQTMCISVQSNL